ncbi:MAG: helix-turn-helix domain-containing protein [Chlamydiota bacterium]
MAEMSEDVKKLGELFKFKRKELNLSLKEVENSTSIRINYLEEIEEGKAGQSLSSVYIIGFVKQYANFLGLDGDQIVKEHAQLFQTGSEKCEFDYGIGTLEKRGSVGGGVKWLPNLIWAAVFIVVLPIVVYYLINYLGWI